MGDAIDDARKRMADGDWGWSSMAAVDAFIEILEETSLDAAWAAAEAALPEGWFLVLSDDPRYSAEATCLAKSGEGGDVAIGSEEAVADTPAAALLALAERLESRR